MSALHGFGLGIASESAAGGTLDVFYPQPLSSVTGELCDRLSDVAGRLDSAQLRELATVLHKMGENTLGDLAARLAESDRPIVASVLADDRPASSVEEAYLKLHGLGLALPLNRFSVTVNPDMPAMLCSTEWRPEDVNKTSLYDLPVPGGYRSSLAIASIAPVTLNHISISSLETFPFFERV